jgi:hypothetical protein
MSERTTATVTGDRYAAQDGGGLDFDILNELMPAKQEQEDKGGLK